jgi:site-specific DNA-cytosine methylase
MAGSALHPDGGGADDGLAGRLDAARGTYVKTHRAASVTDAEIWRSADVAPTLSVFDQGDIRAVLAIVGEGPDSEEPDGQDTARYRCIGNGVIAPVAEWIGRRLLAHLEGRL